MTTSMIEKSRDFLLNKEQPALVLVVEDDAFSMAFMEAYVVEMGHELLKAANGKEAIACMQAHRHRIDVVLMDREMPVMDGLSAVRRIKETPQLRAIPVIMITAADSMQDIRQGLEAGVFYYLTKPVQGEILHSVLSAAIRESRQARVLAEELHQHRTSFNLIDTCKFQFRSLSEAENLAAFMANCFPDPQRVLSGLGELLMNAVEHGNLSIGYQQKTEWLTAGIWRAEINRLQQSPLHAHKTATATIARKEQGMYVVIEDEGEGFEWRSYLMIDPARASDNHGRGIAQANALSFDKLTYNAKGNQAVGFVSHQKRLEW